MSYAFEILNIQIQFFSIWIWMLLKLYAYLLLTSLHKTDITHLFLKCVILNNDKKVEFWSEKVDARQELSIYEELNIILPLVHDIEDIFPEENKKNNRPLWVS